MRSKYNYNELVKVNGIGKNFGKVENKLGFIIRKDDFYDDYYIKMIFEKVSSASSGGVTISSESLFSKARCLSSGEIFWGNGGRKGRRLRFINL